MGYSIDEWFDDHGLPALTKAMEQIKEQKAKQDYDSEDYKSCFDIFMGTLKELIEGSYHGDDRFRTAVFWALFDKERDIKDIIKQAFNLACEEGDIVSLTYDSDYDRIKCYYNAALEYEDQVKEKVYKYIEELVSNLKK